MKFIVLMGSPRLNGNTSDICKPFIEELKNNGAEVRYITLADKNILTCKSCKICQNVNGEYGCALTDDMHQIVESIVWADCIVLATPIYSWYCTAEMKTVLDRHYGLNKFYGSASGSLWEGKSVAIIATHGYKQGYATEPFEVGLKRLCKHSNLNYEGIYSVQDKGDPAVFLMKDAAEGARGFARSLCADRDSIQ